MATSDNSITSVNGTDSTSRSKASSMSEAEVANGVDSVISDDVATGSSSGGENKAKLVMSILRQFIGVKDMASVRFSLPSQLIEPIPNLEYWTYLDRPDYFLCMNDSDDPIERMIAVLRWYLTKDLKLVHGKICKPYNSVLGEFFRCTWNTTSVPTTSLSASMLDSIPPTETVPLSKATSRFKPSFSRKSTPAAGIPQASASVSSTRSTSPTPSVKSGKSASGADVHAPLPAPIRTAFLCEQTSHHPPVSAYIYSCPEKNIEAYGMDQIAAKFTGTTIKVQPGEQNEGIFINLKDRNEEYRCTHPTASICGFLRGSLYAAVQDTAQITCKASSLKTILWYKDEPWIGKPKYAVEGIVFRSNPEDDSKTDTLKDIAEDRIIARIEGCWKGKMYISSPRSRERHILLDVSDLTMAQKTVPHLSKQKPNESRVVWDSVTRAILAKQFEQATRNKTNIEDMQRKVAKKRQEKNEAFVPAYFQVSADGRPTLTAAGQAVLAGQHDESWVS